MTTFRIIGPGRAGRSLLTALDGVGGFQSRGALGRRRRRRRTPPAGVDLLVIATPDDAVAEVACAGRARCRPPRSSTCPAPSGSTCWPAIPAAARSTRSCRCPPRRSARERLASGITFAVAGDPVAGRDGRGARRAGRSRSTTPTGPPTTPPPPSPPTTWWHSSARWSGWPPPSASRSTPSPACCGPPPTTPWPSVPVEPSPARRARGLGHRGAPPRRPGRDGRPPQRAGRLRRHGRPGPAALPGPDPGDARRSADAPEVRGRDGRARHQRSRPRWSRWHDHLFAAPDRAHPARSDRGHRVDRRVRRGPRRRARCRGGRWGWCPPWVRCTTDTAR